MLKLRGCLCKYVCCMGKGSLFLYSKYRRVDKKRLILKESNATFWLLHRGSTNNSDIYPPRTWIELTSISISIYSQTPFLSVMTAETL